MLWTAEWFLPTTCTICPSTISTHWSDRVLTSHTDRSHCDAHVDGRRTSARLLLVSRKSSRLWLVGRKSARLPLVSRKSARPRLVQMTTCDDHVTIVDFTLWFGLGFVSCKKCLSRTVITHPEDTQKERIKEIRSYERKKNKKQHNCQAQSEHGWRFAAIRVSLTQAIGVWSDTRSVIGCPRRWITEMLPRARDPRRSDKEWERRGWELCEDKGMRTTKTASDWVSRVRVHACPISPHRLCPSAIDTRGGPIGVDWERIVCNAYTPYLNPSVYPVWLSKVKRIRR